MLKEMVEMEGIRDKQIGGREGKRIKWNHEKNQYQRMWKGDFSECPTVGDSNDL
jgi:hypothetical protein